VRLRPLRRGDIDFFSTWLPETAAQIACDRWSDAGALEAAIAQEHVLVGDEDGASAFLEYETDAPVRGAAQVRFMAVEPGRRRLGIGGRTALTLERRLKRSTAKIYVQLPERFGLALYFWLRLGYRPLTQREWPVAADGSSATWMVRELR
jgi:GNAT superfamily N-acetyltransferase